jgi:hypothetical protein
LTDPDETSSTVDAVLVYYSADARCRLESALHAERWNVWAVSGRAPDATDAIRVHPADVVVVDGGARDVNVRLAAQHISRTVGQGTVISARPDLQTVDVYRGGHWVGSADSLDAALGLCA